MQVFDAHGARAFEQHAGDEAPRLGPQIGPRHRRPQIRHRGAPAASAIRRAVHRAEAFLPIAVHVVGRRVARLPAGLDERAIQRILHFAGGDVERTVAAVVVVGAYEPCFGALEVRQAMRVRPRFEAARRGPAVVVLRVAADVDHAVDRRRAADARGRADTRRGARPCAARAPSRTPSCKCRPAADRRTPRACGSARWNPAGRLRAAGR